MTIGIKGQMYYSGENFDTPDWWDKWQGENLKKKARVLSRKLKQREAY